MLDACIRRKLYVYTVYVHMCYNYNILLAQLQARASHVNSLHAVLFTL